MQIGDRFALMASEVDALSLQMTSLAPGKAGTWTGDACPDTGKGPVFLVVPGRRISRPS